MTMEQDRNYLTTVVPGVYANDSVYGRYQIIAQVAEALEGSSGSFNTCMEMLANYGAQGEPSKPRKRVRLSLDGALLSLFWEWEVETDDGWQPLMHGGLIFHRDRRTAESAASIAAGESRKEEKRPLSGEWSLHT